MNLRHSVADSSCIKSVPHMTTTNKRFGNSLVFCIWSVASLPPTKHLLAPYSWIRRKT
jgi:hypothetical protein